jgi:hypothetical protein
MDAGFIMRFSSSRCGENLRFRDTTDHHVVIPTLPALVISGWGRESSAQIPLYIQAIVTAGFFFD